MARFVRGTEIFETWLEPGPEPETWRTRICTRNRPGAPPAVSKPDSWDARNAYVKQQLERLEAGWTREVDPEHEELYEEEPREPGLDAALLANPGDIGSLLVYADWLQQRGHPRGALIATQHARTVEDTVDLAAAEAALLDEHAAALLGAAANWIRTGHDAGIELRWNRGFVDYARFDGFFERGETEDVLWELMRHPGARFLHTIEIGCHQPGDQNNQLICATLTRAGPTPPLRRLVIGDFDESDYNGIDISRAPIGDLSLVSLAYPDLEELILKGTGDVDLGELDLPRARLFALRTSTLRATTLATIAGAKWPALEELELWTGDDEYGGDCTAEDLAALFRVGRFPALRRLRIMNTPWSDEICPFVVGAPLAAQLEELDFSLGTLSDAGAATLAAARDRFPNLRALDVFNCSLKGGVERLRRAGFPVEERPPSKRWEINPRSQKPSRYISDAE